MIIKARNNKLNIKGDYLLAPTADVQLEAFGAFAVGKVTNIVKEKFRSQCVSGGILEFSSII